MYRPDLLAEMRAPGGYLDPGRTRRINSGPFCHSCGYGSSTLCVHHQCHEEKAFCADHGTPCIDCHEFYCERHAVEVLDVNQRCENCAYVAFIATILPGRLCQTCRKQEIGETIPTCLSCFWKASRDGIKKSAESFLRMSQELAGRRA